MIQTFRTRFFIVATLLVLVFPVVESSAQPVLSFEDDQFVTRHEQEGTIEDGLTSTVADAIEGAKVGRWHFQIEKGWIRRCISFPEPISPDAKYISLWLCLVPKPADDFLRPDLALELWETRDGSRGRIMTFKLGRLRSPGEWTNYTIPLESFSRAWFSPSKVDGPAEPGRFVEMALNTSSKGEYRIDIDAVEFSSNDDVRRVLVIAEDPGVRQSVQDSLPECEVVQRSPADWLQGDLPTFQMIVVRCAGWQSSAETILTPLREPDQKEPWIHKGAVWVRDWLRNGGLILVDSAETEAGRAFLDGLEGYFRDQFRVEVVSRNGVLAWSNQELPMSPWQLSNTVGPVALLRGLRDAWWPLVSIAGGERGCVAMGSQEKRGWVFAATSAIELPVASVVSARQALRSRVARHDGVDICPENRLWLSGRFNNKAEFELGPGQSRILSIESERTCSAGYLLRLRSFADKPGGLMEASIAGSCVCRHVFALDNEGAMQLTYLLPGELSGNGTELVLSNSGSAPVSIDAVQLEEYADGGTFYIGATAWGDGWGRFPEDVTSRMNVSRVDGHFAWEKPPKFAAKITPICERGSEPVVLLNAPRAQDSVNNVGCGPPKPEFWEKTLTEMVDLYSGQVRFWEVWNEAGEYGWSYKGTADQFADLQSQAYDVIKAKQPGATVICGWMGGVARLLRNGKIADKCDAIAIHTYDPKGNWGAHYQTRIGDMLEYGVWKPLLATEQGFNVNHHSKERLGPLMYRGIGSLLHAGCDMMIAFHLGNPTREDSGPGEWAIMEFDGKGNQRPRETWHGLAFWSQLARGKRVWPRIVPAQVAPDLFWAAARMDAGAGECVRLLLYNDGSDPVACDATLPMAAPGRFRAVISSETGTEEREVETAPGASFVSFPVTVAGAVRVDLVPVE